MTNPLYLWAQRNHIPPAALQDLITTLAEPTAPTVPTKLRTEADAQANCRLEASRVGAKLWRNNVGVSQDHRGNVIRYGLCNESKRVNSRLKSSDLVGIGPGGRFIAREVKRPGWLYKGTAREEGQLNFIILINSLGGDARFSTGGYLQ